MGPSACGSCRQLCLQRATAAHLPQGLTSMRSRWREGPGRARRFMGPGERCTPVPPPRHRDEPLLPLEQVVPRGRQELLEGDPRAPRNAVGRPEAPIDITPLSTIRHSVPGSSTRGPTSQTLVLTVTWALRRDEPRPLRTWFDSQVIATGVGRRRRFGLRPGGRDSARFFGGQHSIRFVVPTRVCLRAR